MILQLWTYKNNWNNITINICIIVGIAKTYNNIQSYISNDINNNNNNKLKTNMTNNLNNNNIL